ncbi:MAG: DUF4328 domain-containing protein [Verrucomicrobiota bacterium JB022]|nr:DUF4328 domain-containing protein [Verrucomicrobiota bacterium JB022]
MIYLSRERGQEGPYPEEEVRRLHEAGELPPRTLYWKQGMPDWRPLSELLGETATDEALARLQPPPMPPTAPATQAAPTAWAPVSAAPARREWSALDGLSNGIVISYGITAVLTLIDVAIGMMNRPAPHATTAYASPLPLIAGLASMAGWVLLLIWTYKAVKNARRMDGDSTSISPLWAVLAWIIPFVNLVMPFFALRVLSRIAKDPRPGYWEDENAHPLIYVWWTLVWLQFAWAMVYTVRIYTRVVESGAALHVVERINVEFYGSMLVSQTFAGVIALVIALTIRAVTRELEKHRPQE